jgi:hypothetical protein
MKITLQDLINHAKSSDIKWLYEIKTVSWLKGLLNNKLDEVTIRFLWNRNDIHWDIVRYQKIPSDMVKDLFEDYMGMRKKKGVNAATFKQAIVSQNITPEIVKLTEDVNNFPNEAYFMLWSTIPEKMVKMADITTFINNISDVTYKDFGFYVKESLIALVREVPETMVTVMEKVLVSKDLCEEIIPTLGKLVFFDDETIELIRQTVGVMTFYTFMEHLISRDHCSVSAKAKYLLSK